MEEKPFDESARTNEVVVEDRGWDELLGVVPPRGKSFATEESYLKTYDTKRSEVQRQLLSFKLGSEEYAVELTDVLEILKYRRFTPVPRTKRFVLGIISLRGVVIPIIDLRRRLGWPDGDVTRRTRILVVRNRNQRFGMVVDGVVGVERTTTLRVEPPLPVIVGSEADFIEGIGRLDKKMVILLNLQEVLDFEATA